MKKIILICILFLTGCDELNELKQIENNTSIIKNIEDKEDEIPIKIEDSIFENNKIEEDNETVISILDILKKEKKKIYSDDELKKLIGNMLIMGFYGVNINKESQIVKDIKKYHLGGVILFDKHPSKKGKAKNIQNPKQLKILTKKLQEYSTYPLLISIDQEGGKVARLKKKTGFKKDYPSAKDIGTKYKIATIEKIYDEMGETLANSGVNLNFAPSVDMEINPKNVVIVKLKRSYGKEPEQVVRFSKIFITSMHKNKILTSLKHFPGHGSSTADSHKGFVDITDSWQEKELEPYRVLIEDNMVDTIMMAHVFNKNIDDTYPASLSYTTVTKKLREELKYNGVVLTDDLQMRAISKHFTLENTIKLSINAGIDMLLFGNQLDPKNTISTKKLVEMTFSLIQRGDINISTIEKANERIKKLKIKI